MQVGSESQVKHSPPLWVIAGGSASGKTECARYLQECGYARFEASDYTVPFVNQHLLMRPHCFAREELYRRLGNNYVARRVIGELNSGPSLADKIVISGIRKWEDIETLRQHRPVEIVAVYRDLKECYEHGRIRAAEGGRVDHPTTLEEFIQLSSWEQSIGLGKLFFEADHHLVNVGSERILRWQLYHIVFAHPEAEEKDAPGPKLSPDSTRWAEWHLCAAGWVRGSWADSGAIHIVDPPPETVATWLYLHEHTEARGVRETTLLLRSDIPDQAEEFQVRFGPCPSRL